MLSLSLPRTTTGWKLSGTETFRLSSAKLMGEYGGNLQNIPKELRQLFIPDEGKIFVQCDQSGAEALIVAYLTLPGRLREIILNGIKPHVYLGLIFYTQWIKTYPEIDEIRKLSIPLITKHPKWGPLKEAIADSDYNPPATRYYYHYKKTCHSGNYEVQAYTLQMAILEDSDGQVALTKQQAEEYLHAYNNVAFPEIPEWRREIDRQFAKEPILRNLFGYPRRFTKTSQREILKDRYAYMPQSTVGCITNIAYVRLQSYIEQRHLDWDLLVNGHDSILLQAPIGQEIEAGRILKEHIEQDLVSPRGEPFKMKSEVQCGSNWGPYKEGVNDDGLKTIKV